MKNLIPLFFALAIGTSAWGADTDLLTPEPHRITDEAIASDIKAIQALQKRLAELNNKGVPIASYHFAKSQAWLDFAMDEYTVNDRSRAIEEALHQAIGIIEPLEKGEKEISLATPIIPTSAMVRPDLWEKAEAMKKNAESFRCAGDKIAQLEVQLVWAGHEDQELGWRHSKPYLQAAERLAREAEAQLAACPPAPVAKAEKPVPIPVPVAVVSVPAPPAASPVPPSAVPGAAKTSLAAVAALNSNATESAALVLPAAKTTAPETSPVSADPAIKPVPTAAAPTVLPGASETSLVATAAVNNAVPEIAARTLPATKATDPAASPVASEAVVKPASATAPAVPVAAVCPPCPTCGETIPVAAGRPMEPIPDRVHFALDRADMSDTSREVLDRITAVMKAEPNLRVTLHGHADQRGEAPYNMKLSRQRAAGVRAYLADAGIAADRIAIAAYGKSRPLIVERTIDGFARNRRVEFVFSIGVTERLIPQQKDLQPEKVKVATLK